jgi:hypothetical protein
MPGARLFVSLALSVVCLAVVPTSARAQSSAQETAESGQAPASETASNTEPAAPADADLALEE